MKKKSKFLSLILRHKPEVVGLTLDTNGWVAIKDLLKALNSNSQEKWTREELEYVVENNDKKRFFISEDGKKIRANQGHSIKVDLEYKSTIPPDCLYHGTISKFVDSIFENGLNKMNRHHVHLSCNTATAIQVGARKGKPLVLLINSKQMHLDGYKFYVSANGVWLTDYVPSQYISITNMCDGGMDE